MTHHSSLSTHHSSLRSGFTLIEMMVVIGILALLVAIVVPVTASLLDRNKASQTKATMKVLEQAITAFSNARPLARAGAVRKHPTGRPAPDEWAPDSFTTVFGSLPPTPTSRVALPGDPIDLAIVAPPWTVSQSYTAEESADTANKFSFLLMAIKGSNWERKRQDPTQTATAWTAVNWLPIDPAKDNASIECLVLCLNELCAESRTILSQLPAASKINQDKDLAYGDVGTPTGNHKPDQGEKTIDLIEIVDAWKHPLRYFVKEPMARDPITGAAAYPAIYELRSAGPDGIFAEPFSSEDASDDVVLKGP